MARPWQCRRTILVFVLAALAGFSSAYAQDREDGNWVLLQDEDSALQITDKKYDQETGEISIVLRNRSNVSVTAFAVALVSSDVTGSGTTLLRGEELVPGDAIAPGASYPMKIALGTPGQASSQLPARAVTLDHEIHSDNTSFGNRASIDKVFQRRAAYFVELERALTRLRVGQGPSSLPKSALPLVKDEAERGREAQQALLDPQGRHTQLERAHMLAVAAIGDLAQQTARLVEEGHLAEQTVPTLERILEDELERFSKNIRPVDLEGYDR